MRQQEGNPRVLCTQGQVSRELFAALHHNTRHDTASGEGVQWEDRLTMYAARHRNAAIAYPLSVGLISELDLTPVTVLAVNDDPLVVRLRLLLDFPNDRAVAHGACAL